MFKKILLASTLFALAAGGLAHAKPDDKDKDKHDTVSAPEIDPISALSALTLFAGGLAVIRGRRRK